MSESKQRLINKQIKEEAKRQWKELHEYMYHKSFWYRFRIGMSIILHKEIKRM